MTKKAQIIISFIVGVGIFLSVCFAAVVFLNNTSPKFFNYLNNHNNEYVFSSFKDRVMANISNGEFIINSSLYYLSNCTLLNPKDALSNATYHNVSKQFKVENYFYNIKIDEIPIAITSKPDGENYTGTIILEGKKLNITTQKQATEYSQVYISNSTSYIVGPLNKTNSTSNFTLTPLYVEEIDKYGQFTIFKKNLLNCGNYINTLVPYKQTTKYLVSADNNIISVVLTLW